MPLTFDASSGIFDGLLLSACKWSLPLDGSSHKVVCDYIISTSLMAVLFFSVCFFSFQSFRTDVEYEVVILPSALLQNWSVWYKIVLHKKGDITKAVTKRQKQLLLPSLWLSKISIWAGLINCLLHQHDTDCTVPTPQKQKYLAPNKSQKSNQIV